MSVGFPRLRLWGDRDRASTYVRRGKIEMYRTEETANRMGVDVFARTYYLSQYSYIHTWLCGTQHVVTIYIQPGDVIESGSKTISIPEPSLFKCPPSLVLYQRKYTMGDNYYATGYGLPLKEAEDGGEDEDLRDYVGKIVTYDRKKKKWIRADSFTGMNTTERLSSAGFDMSSEVHSGGWWGLGNAAALKKLYRKVKYSKCDIITWNGMQSSAFDRSINVNDIGTTFDRDSSKSTLHSFVPEHITLKPWFFFRGMKVMLEIYDDFNNLDPTYVVAGACILADKTKALDYYYVLSYQYSYGSGKHTGQPQNTISVFRTPVKTNSSGLLRPEWKLVGEITHDNLVPGQTGALSNPIANAYISPDGDAYVMHTFYKPVATHVGKFDTHVHYQIGLIKIPLEDPRNDFEIVEWEEEGYPVGRYEGVTDPDVSSPPITDRDRRGKPANATFTKTVNVEITSASSRGKIVGMFGGLDKLYIYRLKMDVAHQESGTMSWAASYETTGTVHHHRTVTVGSSDWFAQTHSRNNTASENILVELICSEGIDYDALTEISRVTLFENTFSYGASYFGSHGPLEYYIPNPFTVYSCPTGFPAGIGFDSFPPFNITGPRLMNEGWIIDQTCGSALQSLGGTHSRMYDRAWMVPQDMKNDLNHVDIAYGSHPATIPYENFIAAGTYVRGSENMWQYWWEGESMLWQDTTGSALTEAEAAILPTLTHHPYTGAVYMYPGGYLGGYPEYTGDTAIYQNARLKTQASTFAATAKGVGRTIYFHHPKRPDNWGYVERTHDANYETGSLKSTVRSFNGWKEIDSHDFDTFNENRHYWLDYAGGVIEEYGGVTGMVENMMSGYGTPNVWDKYLSPTLNEATPPSPGKYKGTIGYVDPNNGQNWEGYFSWPNSYYTVLHEPGFNSYGSDHYQGAEFDFELPGWGKSISPEFEVWMTNPLEMYQNHARRIDLFDWGTYTPTAHKLDIVLRASREYYRGCAVEMWPYCWTGNTTVVPNEAQTSPQLLYKPVYAVAHRPVHGNDWIFVASIPNVRMYNRSLWEHPVATTTAGLVWTTSGYPFAIPGDIQSALVTTPFVASGQLNLKFVERQDLFYKHEIRSDFSTYDPWYGPLTDTNSAHIGKGASTFYTTPNGWFTRQADEEETGMPYGFGFSDRSIITEGISLEIIKKLCEEEEDNFEGIGII